MALRLSAGWQLTAGERKRGGWVRVPSVSLGTRLLAVDKETGCAEEPALWWLVAGGD